MTTSSNMHRVLLVEDERAHVELIRRAFDTDSRFELTHVGSIKEAERHIDDGLYDLIISDLRLPDGQGTQLIRRGAAVQPPPVVVMTSQGNESLAVDALRKGAVDYVVKSPEVFGSMPHVARRAIREWRHIQERDAATERLQLIIDAVPALVAYVDRDGRLKFVNRGFTQWFSRPKAWFIGRAIAHAVGQDVAAALQETFAVAGKHHPLERWVRLPNGERRYIRHESVPHLAYGKRVGFFVLLTDRTEEQRNEQERQELAVELSNRQRLADVGTAAAVFGHEVGNPLNNMYVHLQLLQRKLAGPGGEPFVEDVDSVMREIIRLNTLLREFRTLASKEDFGLGPVDLQSVLSETIRESVRGNDIRVEQHIEPGLGPVHGNAHKLKQVFLNLIKNAIESMPDGGRLRISAIDGGDGHVTVRVVDSGCGIPENVDVFELFRSTKPAGTGLGLPVVKQIVSRHGGSVDHSSSADGGTEFCVRLPLAAPPRAP